ncbi:AAR2-like protein [Nymphaea thermarum]|nr:AAR2-like protein [Nymphaea thermarum]
MDAEMAMELVKKGATLLLLDVPQHTLIGVDIQACMKCPPLLFSPSLFSLNVNMVFAAGPKFCGIKMIPPGPHFIYYSAADRAGNTFSPITGFFIDASASQVIVRKWNGTEEKFVKLLEDEQLGPYALEHFREWKQISGYISKDVIKRIAELLMLVFLQTKLLESIISNDFGGAEDVLLGELQFAFIAFLV